MATNPCRDCDKCTERGLTRDVKRLANLALIICTVGLSALVSKWIHSGRRLCPQCRHPLSRHARSSEGWFKD